MRTPLRTSLLLSSLSLVCLHPLAGCDVPGSTDAGPPDGGAAPDGGDAADGGDPADAGVEESDAGSVGDGDGGLEQPDAGADGGSSSDGGALASDAGPREDAGVDGGNGFVQPAGTVAVGFSVDDTANQTYGTTDGLAWKGSLSFDAITRRASHDPGWGGPYPALSDDGPWTSGGHEPVGSSADDHIWGIAVFIDVPATSQEFEYGAIRGSIAGSDGAWIWSGANGTFTLPANDDTPVTASPLVIPAFGDVDLRLTLDTADLQADFVGFDPAADTLTVKGSAWTWLEVALVDDGTLGDEVASDGVFTFLLSSAVGDGSAQPHIGLLRSGEMAAFVFVLGGIEYKVGGTPSAQGVAAATRGPADAQFLPATITLDGQNNTSITPP